MNKKINKFEFLVVVAAVIMNVFGCANPVSDYSGSSEPDPNTNPVVNTFTVSFDKNADAASGTMVDVTGTVDEYFALPTCDFSYTDHAFLGWATVSGDNAVEYGNEATYTQSTTDSITLYAQWQDISSATTFTITYNGGTDAVDVPASVVLAEGSDYTLSGAGSMTRDGYTFSGWSLTEGGSIITSITNLTSNVDVYAVWEVVVPTYTITFVKNSIEDLTGSISNFVGEAGDTYTIADQHVFKNYYYYQLRWNTQADGNGTNYVEGDVITLVDEDVTLYAIYKLRQVTFHLQFGDEVIGHLNVLDQYQSISGLGWEYLELDHAGDTVTYTNYDEFVTDDPDLYLYGWGKVLNGENPLIRAGEAYTIDTEAIINAGATYTEAEADGTYAFYLWADWRYDITLDVELNNTQVSGGSIQLGVRDFTCNAYYTLPEMDYTDSHWVFRGWTTTEGDGTVMYAPGDSFKVTESVNTVYALWTPLLGATINGGTLYMIDGETGKIASSTPWASDVAWGVDFADDYQLLSNYTNTRTNIENTNNFLGGCINTIGDDVRIFRNQEYTKGIWWYIPTIDALKEIYDYRDEIGIDPNYTGAVWTCNAPVGDDTHAYAVSFSNKSVARATRIATNEIFLIGYLDEWEGFYY